VSTERFFEPVGERTKAHHPLLMLELGVEPTERLRTLVTDLWAVTQR
jgi:hypothetical protein